jgi:hypothetical protein
MIGARKLLLHRKEETTWLASDLPGMQQWLDPTLLSTLYTDSAMTTPVTGDGDVIGAAFDRSGNGRHVIQVTSAKKMKYKIDQQNGLPAMEGITFGACIKGDWSLNPIAQPFTLAIVAKCVASLETSYHFLIDGYDEASVRLFNPYGATGLTWQLGTALTDTTWASNDWNLFVVIGNGANSSIRVNGVQTKAGNAGANSISGITFNCGYSGTSYWNGYIGGAMIYAPSLSAGDLTILETNLITKWGIT